MKTQLSANIWKDEFAPLASLSLRPCLHRNMLMFINHLLDTIDTVPIIYPMKNKILPEWKTRSYKQWAEDPKETTFKWRIRVWIFIRVLTKSVFTFTSNPPDRTKKGNTNTNFETYPTTAQSTQTTKSEAIFMRAPDQKLRNITETQDRQTMQNFQSTISDPLTTILKITVKNILRVTENITRSSDH